MDECNIVNSNQANRSLDPWCTVHERSASCCIRELHEQLNSFDQLMAKEVAEGNRLREEQRQKVSYVIIRTWEVPRGMKFTSMPEFYARELFEQLLAKVDRLEAFCDEADKRGAPYAVALRAVLRATS